MSFLRNKLGGGDNDLSARIVPEDLAIDEIAKYGFQGAVAALAYDPVQSLLAVGTTNTETIPGQIHIFGRSRVTVRYELPRLASVRFLRIYDSRVVVVDTKHELHLYDMVSGQRVNAWSPPGVITCIATDPAVDYIFIGLQSGEVVVYDMDREIIAPFKIPNLWREHSPRAITLPVVSLVFHPRDLGTLLIGYLEGAVVFSVKQNKATTTLKFELPPGAPGAETDPSLINSVRRPKLTGAIFNPSGSTIMTAHEDGCMAFWNPGDGRLLQARTLQDSDVHLPSPHPPSWNDGGLTFSVREPFFKIAWCCSQNIDETTVLVAGGNSMGIGAKGLTFFDFGLAPSNITSSWQQISEHYASPKRQRVLPVPQNSDVIDFCVIPRTFPYYSGCHDPLAVVVIYANGEIGTLRYPDGLPISPAGTMHAALGMVQPKPTFIDVVGINRVKWLDMTETRDRPDNYLRGGAEARRVLRRYQDRSIAYTVHEDATVRLWDLGHNDEIESPDAIEVDVGSTVGKHAGVKITALASSSVTAEMAVGLETGELLIYRWGKNNNYRQQPGYEKTIEDLAAASIGTLKDISGKADPRIKEGLLPFWQVDMDASPVKTTVVSDVGFVAVGYDNGSIVIIDLRGPTIMYTVNLSSLTKDAKRSSLRRSSAVPQGSDLPVTMAFSVMTLEDENYSSICLHVGTSMGHIATFKILPEGAKFKASFAGAFVFDEAPIKLLPVNADNGEMAYATPNAVGGLREGQQVNGMLVCVGKTNARVIRPTNHKMTHRTWDDTCMAASIVEEEDKGIILACMMNTGKIRAWSLPHLKEIGSLDLSSTFDKTKLSSCQITREGFVVLWTGATELLMLNIWGIGKALADQVKDTPYNPNAEIPLRPTITGLQWISGTQHVSTDDFDLLIGGPDRPMSRRQIAEAREREREERLASMEQMRAGGGGGGEGSSQGPGVFGNMAAAFNQRTQNLTNFQDNMQSLENTTADFAKATTKFIEGQKKKAMLGSIKSFF